MISIGDQYDDRPLQPNRARRVDEIRQRARGLADHVDLGVERAARGVSSYSSSRRA